jgi:hypothetical protein
MIWLILLTFQVLKTNHFGIRIGDKETANRVKMGQTKKIL